MVQTIHPNSLTLEEFRNYQKRNLPARHGWSDYSEANARKGSTAQFSELVTVINAKPQRIACAFPGLVPFADGQQCQMCLCLLGTGFPAIAMAHY